MQSPGLWPGLFALWGPRRTRPARGLLLPRWTRTLAAGIVDHEIAAQALEAVRLATAVTAAGKHRHPADRAMLRARRGHFQDAAIHIHGADGSRLKRQDRRGLAPRSLIQIKRTGHRPRGTGRPLRREIPRRPNNCKHEVKRRPARLCQCGSARQFAFVCVPAGTAFRRSGC
jgi:hypothetical protein